MLYTLAETFITGFSLRSIFLTWALTYVVPGGHFEFILGLAIKKQTSLSRTEIILLNSILECRLKNATILNSKNSKTKLENFVISRFGAVAIKPKTINCHTSAHMESNWKHEDKKSVATLLVDKISHQLKYFMLTFGSYKILIM